MDNNIKKTRTKKELKAYYALSRSTVGQGRNMGTISHKSQKKYDRGREKRRVRTEVAGCS